MSFSVAPGSKPPPSQLVEFRNAFISGALLLAPLVVTLWAFSKIIDLVGGTFRPLFFFYLPASVRDRPSLAILWDILATLIVIILVTVLGYVSRDVFGRFFVSIAERFFLSIPGVGAVYITVKQIVDTFGTPNRNLFSKVVLVEFPRAGVWAIGFLTNKAQGEAQSKLGVELWTVFVPTTPNPTSGYLIMLAPEKIVELEMTVGEGMKMIISGGAVLPPSPPAPANKPSPIIAGQTPR